MKKWITWLLSWVLLLLLAACVTTDIPENTEAPTVPTEATIPSEEPIVIPERNDPFRDYESAQAFVEDMGTGWNLGNSLDPVDCHWVGNELDYETAWGNPKVTRELIAYIKEQGFDTVRIPITWLNHVGEAPDYPISLAWMGRVQEIVDWCIDEDLFVIINMHHEDQWLMKASTDYEDVMTQYKAIWTQIALRFQGYSEKLIFESMNEVGFEDLSTLKGCELINQINEEFVQLIRSTGGNNEKRYLLLAGYLDNIDESVAGGITTPDDDRTILCMHYYYPQTFAIADSNSDWGYQRTWGTDGDFEYLDKQMKKLYNTYVKKGTPVIIGEFGAIHTDKEPEDVVLYTASITEYALKYHMCPIWWDNGSEIDRMQLAFQIDGMEESIKAAKENGIAARDK